MITYKSPLALLINQISPNPLEDTLSLQAPVQTSLSEMPARFDGPPGLALPRPPFCPDRMMLA